MDVICRNLMAFSIMQTQNTCSLCCRGFCFIASLLALSSSLCGLFLIVCNGFRLLVTYCGKGTVLSNTKTDDVWDPLDKKSIDGLESTEYDIMGNFIESIKLQYDAVRVLALVFPASWLLLVVSFLIVIAYYEPEEQRNDLEDERERRYRGLNTEEIDQFTQKSKN